MIRLLSGMTLALALCSLTACQTGDTNSDSDIASLDSPVSTPKEIKSVSDWDQLDKDARLAVLERDFGKYNNLRLTERIPATAAKDPAQKAFIAKMMSHMETNGNMTVDDASHAKVGPTQVFAQLLVLDGKTILGGEVHFVQMGCDMPDETAPTFKTKAQAEDANCEMSPASIWSAHGAFSHDGIPIESGDFMEWGAL